MNKKIVTLAFGLGLAVVLGACSEDKPTPTTSPTAKPPAATTPAKPPAATTPAKPPASP